MCTSGTGSNRSIRRRSNIPTRSESSCRTPTGRTRVCFRSRTRTSSGCRCATTLTAPLARYVAANFDALPKPFRRYQSGYVYRNEKPGPGRFRQFMQFDADTVGTANPGRRRGNVHARGRYARGARHPPRQLWHEGFEPHLARCSPGQHRHYRRPQRLVVLRAVDKFDRLGLQGVAELLGKGRKDESGDFTQGAELSSEQANADPIASLRRSRSRGRNCRSHYRARARRWLRARTAFASMQRSFAALNITRAQFWKQT